MNKQQKKISIYPTDDMGDRINKEYEEYLNKFDSKEMSKPLSKAAFILWLVNEKLNEMVGA